jgi:hypothetical protein
MIHFGLMVSNWSCGAGAPWALMALLGRMLTLVGRMRNKPPSSMRIPVIVQSNPAMAFREIRTGSGTGTAGS